MELTVKPLNQKYANNGIAAIDTSVMDELNLDDGNYISLESNHDSDVLRVWPGYPEDKDRNIIRIDGQTRKSLNSSIDEKVEIFTANIQPAESITIAISENLNFRGNADEYFRSNLAGQAVESGKTVFVDTNLETGQAFPIHVVKTRPESHVVVTDATYIQFNNHSAEYWRS
ncbi:CDC48 family AAA ATPase [Halanaeroarchaeum sulfurireducens]|uniref:hypothetical protein n=1 Tax=Halanaeroarchaeum sulfurireducens TaxID=1604004 RepID=UPI0009AD3371|nr:hypothetical protein [Halanaeroarchaeum sulfurireducens]